MAPAPVIPQLAVRATPYVDGFPAGNVETNERTWVVKLTSIPTHGFEGVGLKSLVTTAGSKNELIAEIFARSPYHELAKGHTNVTLNARGGVFAAACSMAEVTNLIARLEATAGIDILTPLPIKTSGTNRTEFFINENLPVEMERKGDDWVTVNFPVGPRVYLRAEPVGEKTRVEAALQMESFHGHAKGPKNPSPVLDLSVIGSRVDLEKGEALLMAGPVERSVVQIVDRVPTLSGIPVLGKLFTKRKSQTNEFRYVVIIHPKAD